MTINPVNLFLPDWTDSISLLSIDFGVSVSSIESLQAGMLIDGYELVRELDRGGMGCVYLATRAEKTHALKFQLSQNLESLTRFEREAKLSHKSINILISQGFID